MPQAIPAVIGAAVAGYGAATTIGAVTILGVSLSAAAFGAVVAVGSNAGPIAVVPYREPTP